MKNKQFIVFYIMVFVTLGTIFFISAYQVWLQRNNLLNRQLAKSNVGKYLTAKEGAYKYTDELTLFDIEADIPEQRQVITETKSEIWFYVPKWVYLSFWDEKSECFLRSDSNFNETSNLYRNPATIVIFNKSDKKWRGIGVSKYADAIYPVKCDPYEKNLIWFGCNDGAPGMHADGPGGCVIDTFDAPLLFGYRPGGLGVIDINKRTVRYFGPFAHLISSRVYEMCFDEDSVWIWGRYPLSGTTEPNGIACYDRKTELLKPFPIERYPAGWSGVAFHQSKNNLWISTIEKGEWFNRYKFDRENKKWVMFQYVWVDSDTPLLEGPQDNSSQVAILKKGMHFGKQGHSHLGHPLIVIDSNDRWCKIMTCQNIIGWVNTSRVMGTMDFFKRQISIYEPHANRENEDRGRLIFCSHMYMTPGEIDEIIKLLEKEVANVTDQLKKRELNDFLEVKQHINKFCIDGFYKEAENLFGR
jgi:hypothetical protein